MSQLWLSKIFDFNVERREIPRKNNKPFLPMGRTQIGVLHTTEGFGVNSAWATLNQHHSAPHFIVGENRIVQCRPIGVQGAALKGAGPSFDNQHASVQIEMCGFTGGSSNFAVNAMKPWIPVEETLRPLVAVMAYCAGNGIDIPLQRPSANWLDDGSDIKTIWAISKNTRRLSGVWPNAKGWYYHLEVPNNDHYDCGAMRCTEIMAMARELAATAQSGQPADSSSSTSPQTQPGNASSSAVLRDGDRGESVKRLQTKLIALGLLGQGENDGIFGPKTLAAVRKFQSNKGLQVDGIAGPATNSALDKASQASAAG